MVANMATTVSPATTGTKVEEDVKQLEAVVKPENVAPSTVSPDFKLLLKNFQSSA